MQDIKNLKKIIELCQKTGVLEIEFEGLKLKFDLHHTTKENKRTTKEYNRTPKAYEAGFDPGPIAVDKVETPDELTEEQLLFYSVQQMPEETEMPQ